MAATQHFNAVIIGSGQAGTPLARALADSGRRIALIERVHVGGTCVSEGCTPSRSAFEVAPSDASSRRQAWN